MLRWVPRLPPPTMLPVALAVAEGARTPPHPPPRPTASPGTPPAYKDMKSRRLVWTSANSMARGSVKGILRQNAAAQQNPRQSLSLPSRRCASIPRWRSRRVSALMRRCVRVWTFVR